MEATRVKPTEIRIGNILKGGKVKEFNKTVVHFEATRKPKSVTYYGYQHINCKPIPLTEEWLLRLGFQKELSNDEEERTVYSIQVSNNDSLYLDSDEAYISHYWNNNHMKNSFWKIPKTVDQLQNLYYFLSGEELILKY